MTNISLTADVADDTDSRPFPFEAEPGIDPEAALGALSDPDCRDVLAATTGEARTAGELMEGCDIPRSTLYRKIEQLTDAGLLEEGVRLGPNGGHASEYRRTVERLTVSLSTDAPAGSGTGIAAPASD